MATFTNTPRNNAGVGAFQWHTTDGEVLPYVRFFAEGGYFYFDNQQPANNTSAINDGDWVLQVGSGPSTRYARISDAEFRVDFNP